MSLRLCSRFGLFASVIILMLAVPSRASVHFQPVSQEELKMTSEPLAPGAPAIILYREVNRDDNGHGHGGLVLMGGTADRFEEDYFRVKVFTQEGRKYGDVEIPLPSEMGIITDINARTIRPDGSVVNFSGKIFDKTIVKARGFQYRAKTFSMPNVEPGCIIEYYYTVSFNEGYIFFSQWVLSDELFTKKAKFTLHPFHNDYVPLNFRWNEHLPTGMASPKQNNDGTVELDAMNIAAFHAEDLMPPQNEFKARVDFIYSLDAFESDPATFWKKVGKKRFEQMESFINKRGAMEQALSQIVSPADSPEIKLRKIYTRVQQFRNTSFEVRKTAQEQRRENRKNDESVEDVWKQGHGDQTQLNWLCLALARAAGIEVYGVWTADRSNYFFDPRTMQSGKLDRNVVLVKLNGKDVYLAPGTPFTPFGMLPWEETEVQGLRLEKDGGSWIQTSHPETSESQITRKAELKLAESGELEGKFTVTFSGLEALRRRLDERNQDEAARKAYLEDEVKQYIPAASEISLSNQPDWTSSESPLAAEFAVKIPGWASISGHRALLPLGIFSGTEKHVFEYSARTYPIYFEFRSGQADDINIELPSGWEANGLPKPQNHDLHAVAFALSAENSKTGLHLTRKLDVNALEIDPKYYTALRSFYQGVKAADEQQIVLISGTAASGN